MAAGRQWWSNWRAALAGGLVLAQLVAVLLAHSGSSCCASRYFAWAPNDYSVDYRISVTVAGRPLSRRQIASRYRLAARGFWEDPPSRLERYLRRRDQLYGGDERIRLVVWYRLDGHRPVIWSWSHG